MTNIPYPKHQTLIATQQAVIKEALDGKRRNGEIKSENEYQHEYEHALRKIEGGIIFTEARKQAGTTDAEAFNETFREAGLDLAVVFQTLNQLEESSTSHTRLNLSTLNSIKMRIKSIANSLTHQEKILGKRSNDGVHVETFSTGARSEEELGFYTERRGQSAPLEFRASWEPEVESIRLPGVVRENAMIGKSGVRLGSIHLLKQLGAEQADYQDSAQSLNQVIDSDNATYWSDNILMDEPIRVAMGKEYGSIDFGALFELEARFDYLTSINEISLHPFCSYPMDLVRITVFETDDPEEQGRELLREGAADAKLRPHILAAEELLRFPDTNVKRVRLLFNQRHYIKRDLLVSDRARRHHEIRNQSQAGNAALTGLKELTADAVLDALMQDDKKRVTRYEYQYGFYNIGFTRNEFHNTGIYISKPVESDGNAKSFRLETTERHPEVAGFPRFTDIEYAVHDGVKWHELLPFTQKRVKSELLMPEIVGGLHQAVTRFRIEGSHEVMKNGVPLTGAAILLQDQRTFVFSEYDPSSFYTIAYDPEPSAFEVDFLKAYRDYYGKVTPNHIQEEFDGTDAAGRVQLKNHPFLDRERLNAQPEGYDPSYLENEFLPLIVKLVDSNGYRIEQAVNDMQQNIGIRNRTDYLGGSNIYLEPFDDHEAFYQYVVEGDSLRFNTVIPKDTRIVVSYPSLVSRVRLRAILRRNSSVHPGLTPILEDYVAHSQVLK